MTFKPSSGTMLSAADAEAMLAKMKGMTTPFGGTLAELDELEANMRAGTITAPPLREIKSLEKRIAEKPVQVASLSNLTQVEPTAHHFAAKEDEEENRDALSHGAKKGGKPFKTEKKVSGKCAP